MKPNYSFKLTQRVNKYIEDNKMIGHGDTVIVGLSGGADSVCLILLLNSLREKIGFDLHAVHINHGIRGESAKRDELFSWKLCEKYGIPYTAYEVNVKELAKKEGLTVEEAGREARYACFYDYFCELIEQENDIDNIIEEIPEKINSSESDFTNVMNNVRIAVAHHMDDQAETVIFNMIRGSGINGIGGMEPISSRDGMEIIRPLLCMTRAEIVEYLKFEGQEYCTDETNLENDYSRNQIRNVVIPGLNEVQPRTSEHIAFMAKEAREAADYIESVVKNIYEEIVIQVTDSEEKLIGYKIPIKSIKNEKPIIVRELIIYVLKHMITTYKDITKTHIEDIYSLIYKGKGKKINLPYGLEAIKEKEYLFIK